MSAAYSPNANAPLGFDLPMDLRTGARIDAVWKRWLEFDPVVACERYADNLKKLEVKELIDNGKDTYDKYKVSDAKGLHTVFYKGKDVAFDAYFGEDGERIGAWDRAGLRLVVENHHAPVAGGVARLRPRAGEAVVERQQDTGRLEEAVPVLEKNTELQPFSPYGFYQLGMTYHHLGRSDDAWRIVEKLKHFEPRYAATLKRDIEGTPTRAATAISRSIRLDKEAVATPI